MLFGSYIVALVAVTFTFMLTPSFTWENSYLHSNTCARERPLTPGGQDREHGTQWTQCGENAVPLGENLC